jgi:glycosyltransferase involved in cell wall biosynthesis
VKITVLVPSLASNGIARASILAKLLARHYEVEAIGRLKTGESVFPWFRDDPWIEVHADGLWQAMNAMERRITGDVVIAYGVSMTSLGAGILARRRRGTPLILDMPEWEVHDHYKWPSGPRRWAMIARNLLGPGWSEAHSFKWRYILDHLVSRTDARTVCCRFLADRHGGVLLPQGPDPDQFDPARYDKVAIRRKWKLPEDATLLFFGGNPQPRKGLEETIAALRALEGRVKARLVIVGRDESHPYTKKLVEMGGALVAVLGPQPFHLMPELLATADLVALTQTSEPQLKGYIPCKIYEAMAMEIPVISSRMSDIPEILEGCGYVVPPDDSRAVQTMIEHVLTHPEEARQFGQRARRRVVERYSWDVMDRVLHGVVESVAGAELRGRGASLQPGRWHIGETERRSPVADRSVRPS